MNRYEEYNGGAGNETSSKNPSREDIMKQKSLGRDTSPN